MNQTKITVSAVTGTSAMTAFSYLASHVSGHDFREPVLLAKMANTISSAISKKQAALIGWMTHYLVGLLFAELYAPFWTENKAVNAKRGLILGGLTGIAAVLIWKFTMAAHPEPPSVHFPFFALQLVMAHIIFGCFTALSYGRSPNN